MKTVSISELKELMSQSEVNLIDVRSKNEYEACHIPGAVNIPLDSVNPQEIINKYENQDIYIVCQAGGRSAKACEMVASCNHEQVYNVVGGTGAWESAGFDVVKDSSKISIQRQVQMLAGGIVLLGALLSYSISREFILLSAFIGAGLLITGLTNTCGMGLLLAKMPWN